VWHGATYDLKNYAVDDEHLFVFEPDRVLCVTR
jgi:hypothetical protein